MFSKVFVAFVGNGRHWGLDPQSDVVLDLQSVNHIGTVDLSSLMILI